MTTGRFENKNHRNIGIADILNNRALFIILIVTSIFAISLWVAVGEYMNLDKDSFTYGYTEAIGISRTDSAWEISGIYRIIGIFIKDSTFEALLLIFDFRLLSMFFAFSNVLLLAFVFARLFEIRGHNLYLLILAGLCNPLWFSSSMFLARSVNEFMATSVAAVFVKILVGRRWSGAGEVALILAYFIFSVLIYEYIVPFVMAGALVARRTRFVPTMIAVTIAAVSIIGLHADGRLYKHPMLIQQTSQITTGIEIVESFAVDKFTQIRNLFDLSFGALGLGFLLAMPIWLVAFLRIPTDAGQVGEARWSIVQSVALISLGAMPLVLQLFLRSDRAGGSIVWSTLQVSLIYGVVGILKTKFGRRQWFLFIIGALYVCGSLTLGIILEMGWSIRGDWDYVRQSALRGLMIHLTRSD